jgi:hypothetical protein
MAHNSENIQSKHWAFTLPNYTDDDERRLKDAFERGGITSLKYGREIGSSGKPQLQGHVSFEHRKRELTVLKVLNIQAHLSVVRDLRSHLEYNARVVGVVEYGGPEHSADHAGSEPGKGILSNTTLNQCPSCHEEYDANFEALFRPGNDRETLRIPVSCSSCSYTLCLDCVKTRHYEEPQKASRYLNSCLECGKSNAFDPKKPSVNKLACQLLEQLKKRSRELSPERYPDAEAVSSMATSSSVQRLHGLGSRMLSSDEQSLIGADEPPVKKFPSGMPVLNDGERGEIRSSFSKRFYSVQYGDGDPRDVDYNKLKVLLEAAKANKGRDDAPIDFRGGQENDVNETFVGRTVFKAIKYFGGYWGTVRSCQDDTCYTIVYERTGQSEVLRHRHVQALLDAIKEKEERGHQQTPTTAHGQETRPSQHPEKRTLADTMATGGRLNTPSPNNWSTPDKSCKRPRCSQGPDTAQFELVKVGNHRFPALSKGSGWDGFEKYMPDEVTLDHSLDVLELMDFFFPVAAGEESFYTSIGQNEWHATLNALADFQRENPEHEGLIWHRRFKPYTPKTKQSLAAFFKVLMGLKFAPKLANQDDMKDYPVDSKDDDTSNHVSSSGHRLDSRNDERVVAGAKSPDLLEAVGSSPAIYLPAQARGTGWDGFNRHISDKTLPKKFSQIFHLIDFFFPVAAGENSFYNRLWVHAKDPNGSTPGVTTRRAIADLRDRNPNLEGISWHKNGQQYAPDRKEDLAAFIKLLMSLEAAPEVDGSVQLGGQHTEEPEFYLPREAKGAGWEGFNLIPETRYPKTLKSILKLIDYLFPVARSKSSFYKSLWLDACTRNGATPRRTLNELYSLLSKHPFLQGLKWEKHLRKYSPPTKKDLGAFIVVLTKLKSALEPESESSYPQANTNAAEEHQQENNSMDGYDTCADSLGTREAEEIGQGYSLPAEAKGSGWTGFANHVSDVSLPKRFEEVLELMDFFFPVAAGEESFHQRLWVNAFHKDGRGKRFGEQTRVALNVLQKQYPDLEGLRWHQKNGRYAPPTKNDLGAFIKLLMDLDVSTKSLKASSSRTRSPAVGRSLPAKAQGSGWKGFEYFVTTMNLPKSFAGVLELMDELFVVSDGEDSFYQSLYENAGNEHGHCPGKATFQALRDIKEETPDLAGIRWHSDGQLYAPKTKSDLAAFVKLLMKLDTAPKMPPEIHQEDGTKNHPRHEQNNSDDENGKLSGGIGNRQGKSEKQDSMIAAIEDLLMQEEGTGQDDIGLLTNDDNKDTDSNTGKSSSNVASQVPGREEASSSSSSSSSNDDVEVVEIMGAADDFHLPVNAEADKQESMFATMSNPTMKDEDGGQDCGVDLHDNSNNAGKSSENHGNS